MTSLDNARSLRELEDGRPSISGRSKQETGCSCARTMKPYARARARVLQPSLGYIPRVRSRLLFSAVNETIGDSIAGPEIAFQSRSCHLARL